MNQENNINLSINNIQLGKTKLSLASLILTILQVVMPLLASFVKPLSFLGQLPYIIIALILAIISKCKYNDKLSLVMIVIDAVLIGVVVIVLMLAIICFAAAIEAIIAGCDGKSA